MRNLKLILEYVGTRYAGFQKQPRSPTIQGELERALTTLVKEDIKIHYSSRTDAGVHATFQVANFHTSSRISLPNLLKSLNGLLPSDISITDLAEAPESFDSKRDAVARRYKYYILNQPYPSPFLKDFSYQVFKPLDVKLMDQAIKHLEGTHDFTTFCRKDKGQSSKTRTAYKAQVAYDKKRAPRLIKIDIKANAFLYNMVRIITGTLINVGLGKISPTQFKELLKEKDSKNTGPTAPARGLILSKVYYR